MPRSPEAPRFKRIIKKAERIGAAGLAATSLTTGIDAAISSVSAKAPEAAVASPSKSFELKTPQDVLKSVQAELASKDKKPKGGKGTEQASGKSETEKEKGSNQVEGPVTVEQQIEAVSTSIQNTLDMTPKQFKKWTKEKNSDGISNAISMNGLVPFDFPVELRSVGNPPSSEITNDGFIIYNGDESHKFPHVEHMGLLAFNPDNKMWISLAFYNGSVTIPVPGEQDGQVTISFATSLWPNGARIPYSWVSNLNLPNNPRLGPNQESFTNNPLINHTLLRSSANLQSIKGKFETREEFLQELSEQEGKPIMVAIARNSIIAQNPNFAPDGTFLGYTIDARIPGVDINPFEHIYDQVREAYFAQDQNAFDAAVQEGVTAGIFLPSSGDATAINNSITTTLSKIQNFDTIFSTLPLAQIGIFPDATSPKALTSS